MLSTAFGMLVMSLRILKEGRYKILETIGQGRMGAVYKAQDTKLGCLVAVKTIRNRPTETALKSFKQEIDVLARLNHPNIVGITDTDEVRENGTKRLCLVRPFLESQSLARIIEQQADQLTVERCVRIIAQVCRALHAAHQAKLIHRNVKPSNIFLLENDCVNIVDFGVTRLANPKSSPRNRETLLYLSPEQIDLRNPTARSDIFSVAVVFYEMLAKRHPFSGETQETIADAIKSKYPPLASVYNQEVNESLCRIIYKALEKNPRKRFPTAADLADSLEKALKNEPIAYFDLSKIRPRLQTAMIALQTEDLSLVTDILEEIDSEGYSHPEIDMLRMKFEQAQKQIKIRQLLGTVQKYFELAEFSLALEKLNMLLKLEPTHRAAKDLKIKIEDHLTTQSTENPMALATGDMDNDNFQNARAAVQNASNKTSEYAAAKEAFNELNRDVDMEHLEKRSSSLRSIASAFQKCPEDRELQKSEQEAPQGSERKKRSEELLRQARTCNLNQKYNQALPILEQASRLDPNNPEIEGLLVETLLSFAKALLPKDWNAAERLLQRVLSRDNNNDEAKRLHLVVLGKKREEGISRLTARARELQSKGEIDEAKKVLREGLTQCAGDSRISQLLDELEKSVIEQNVKESLWEIENRVKDLVFDEHYKEAEALIEENLHKHPNNPRLTILLKYVHEARKEARGGEEVNEIIVSINKVLKEKSSLAKLKGVSSSLERALATYPDDAHLRECGTRLQREIDQSLHEIESFKGDAQKYIKQRNLRRAASFIDRALELDPENEQHRLLKDQIVRQVHAAQRTAFLKYAGLIPLLFILGLAVGYKIPTLYNKTSTTDSRVMENLGAPSKASPELDYQNASGVTGKETSQTPRTDGPDKSSVKLIGPMELPPEGHKPSSQDEVNVLNLTPPSNPKTSPETGTILQAKKEMGSTEKQSPPTTLKMQMLPFKPAPEGIQILLENAQTAFDHGEFALPEDQSALFFSSLVLKLDRDNSTAQGIRRESCKAASAEIRELRRQVRLATFDTPDENREANEEDSERIKRIEKALGKHCQRAK